MQRFIEKFGSLLLSVVIAIGTIGYFKANTENNITRLNEKAAEYRESQKQLEARLTDAEKNGTQFARNATSNNAEKIASLEAKADKLIDLAAGMQVTQAAMQRDIAFLVQVCGQGNRPGNHAKVSLRIDEQSLANTK